MLAVGQQDGQISLWDAGTLCKLSSFVGHGDFVAVAGLLAGWHDVGLVCRRLHGANLGRDERRERFSIPAPIEPSVPWRSRRTAACWHLATGLAPLVRIWDLTSEKENEPLAGARGPVVAVAISPDGSTLAAADLQGFVTFWNVSTRLIRPKRLSHSGVYALAFEPRRPRSCNRRIRRHDSPLGLSDRGGEIS